jgi:hypothetical protein
MTQDEIIALAKQVGFPIRHPDWQKAVEEFAALVEEKATAIEREACAKVVEDSPSYDWHKFACESAAAIRARGQA